jgi:hypothetical protein
LAREPIFRLVRLGLRILQRSCIDNVCEYRFRSLLYNAAFSWFAGEPKWSAQNNTRLAAFEINLVMDVYQAVQNDKESIDPTEFYLPERDMDSRQSGFRELRNTARDIAPGILRGMRADTPHGNLPDAMVVANHQLTILNLDNLRRFSRWRRLFLVFI